MPAAKDTLMFPIIPYSFRLKVISEGRANTILQANAGF
jgi:hypothetical protein